MFERGKDLDKTVGFISKFQFARHQTIFHFHFEIIRKLIEHLFLYTFVGGYNLVLFTVIIYPLNLQDSLLDLDSSFPASQDCVVVQFGIVFPTYLFFISV